MNQKSQTSSRRPKWSRAITATIRLSEVSQRLLRAGEGVSWLQDRAALVQHRSAGRVHSACSFSSGCSSITKCETDQHDGNREDANFPRVCRRHENSSRRQLRRHPFQGARGLGLDIGTLSARAGLSTALTNQILGGSFDEPGVRALAAALELHPDRLAAIGRTDYRPAEIP